MTSYWFVYKFDSWAIKPVSFIYGRALARSSRRGKPVVGTGVTVGGLTGGMGAAGRGGGWFLGHGGGLRAKARASWQRLRGSDEISALSILA